MKTQEEIKAEIAKLEKGLKNPNVPENFKQKGREKIAQLKKDLNAAKPTAKPKDKPAARAPKDKPAPKPAAKKAPRKKKESTFTKADTENYMKRLSKRATEIQKAGGMKENEDCKKKVYRVNRADAVKKAAKEIKYDAGNKNRSGFMDGLASIFSPKKK